MQIIFPDLSDANIKPIEKSQVIITGIIDGVYKARQMLIVSPYLIVNILEELYVCSHNILIFLCFMAFSTGPNLMTNFTFNFRQMLNLQYKKQGNLPVALIFDYPENSVKHDINNIMTEFGVFIAARHKQRQSTLCIVIKGIEKYVGNYLFSL